MLMLGPVQIDKTFVPCFERLELTFTLNGTFDNPFDPRQIRVDASFRPPNGETLTVSAFPYQELTDRKRYSSAL